MAHESEHEGNADRAKMLADLAAAHRETMRLSDRKVKVARIRITDAGRRALEG